MRSAIKYASSLWLILCWSVQLIHAASVKTTELSIQGRALPGFIPLAPSQSGLFFTNLLDEASIAANRVLETGSGLAAGDYDGDRLVDLFFCSLSGESRLYRNLGGLKFSDVTAASGIDCKRRICRGSAFADIDGDGDLDLLVSALGQGVICFRNDGAGRFTEITQQAGTASPFASMTMTLADVDGNGTLDLYVANYRTNDVRDAGQVQLESVNGQTVVPSALRNRFILMNGIVQEYGDPDLLYLNDGAGHFRPVSWVQGAFLDEGGKPLKTAPFDWGLTAAFHDLNNDGSPDLYVCNDYWTPDRVWINDGRGNFRALPSSALRHTSASSMGVDFADIDRDGNVDFFVVDMLASERAERLAQIPAHLSRPTGVGEIFDEPQLNRNTLFHNRGDATFEEIADYSRVIASDWSWQPIFLDVDLDGYEDLMIANGHTKNIQDRDVNESLNARRPRWVKTNGMVNIDGKLMPFQQAFTTQRARELREYPGLRSRILTLRNTGNLKFDRVDWGFNESAIHHGIVLADLDNDGDLDVVVNTLNSPAEIWLNQSNAPRVAVQLHGIAPNTQAVGAKVTLRGKGVPVQTQELACGGKYLSSSQGRVVFACREARDLTLEITWRSGGKTLVPSVQLNRLYEIEETTSDSALQH